MIKKSIIALAAIVAVVGIVFAAGGAGHSNSTNSNDLEKQQKSSSDTNASTATTVNASTKISATKAKEIASKYIDSPGATAGTPKLTTEDGKKVYVVPVIDNGQQVGEIDIDAQTGENLGGAGGAP